MNVGFYYHVEAVFDQTGVARVPSLIGLFVEELARQVGHVTFYVHGNSKAGIEDFVPDKDLVRCVDLGPRARFPERMFLPRKSLRRFHPHRDGIDVMLVRGPSPLLPHVVKASAPLPVAVHIVGDYANYVRDRRARSMPWWRDTMIRLLFRLSTPMQRRACRNALILVNAPDLAKLFDRPDDVGLVFDSTLTEDMVVLEPASTASGLGRSRRARLLFTGRLVPEKGLWEAVDAVRLLVDRGFDIELDIVGWEDPADPVVERLKEHANRVGVGARIRFVGYVPAGAPLASVYRESDIYIWPSHGNAEGFPRTLFEAMGSGIPVVATPVGGVPHWIRDGEQAVMVEPGSAGALADGVESLLVDDALRNKVAGSGWEFARQWTVTKCCEQLAHALSDWAGKSRTSSSKT